MSTEVKDRLDLDALIGPLEKEPEPKTLDECLLEAGGFPFVARAVLPPVRKAEYTISGVPVGFETQFTEWCAASQNYMIGPELRKSGLRLDAAVRRWFLVGHRT